MVLLNSKRVLFLTAFSQGILSAAVKNICGKDIGEQSEEVNTVSKQLKISSCDALNVYDYIVKGEDFFKDIIELEVDINFSEENCKKKCNEANKKLLGEFKNVDQKILKVNSKQLLKLDFVTTCEEICHYGALDAQVLKKKNLNKKVLDNTIKQVKSEFEKMEKRDKPCDPVSQGKIKKSPSSPYRYGYYRYTQESGSAQTAISVVNGCGPKNNAQVSAIVGNLPYAEDFRPACNSHDICVTCHQLPRSGCDSQFKINMKAICSTMYQVNSGDNVIVRARKALKRASCNIMATLFADTVSLFGENAYQDTPVNTSPNCAACGVSIIKNTLYHTPFYVLK